MVWRYAKYRGVDVSYPESGAFKSTVDWQSVDSFAVEPLKWTAATGILSGVNLSNGTRAIQPAGNATRAQAAKVFSVVTGDVLSGKVKTPKAAYAVLYSNGRLSLQRGADTSSSYGKVLGKWEWDGQSSPWIDMRARVRSVVVRDRVNYYGTGSLFKFLTNCKTFDVAKLNVSAAGSLAWMFRACESVTALDLSSWDVSHFKDFWQMFTGCSSLRTLNLSGWNVSGVDSFGFMFSGCRSLRMLDISGWAPKAAISGEQIGFDPSLLTTVTVGNKFNHAEWFSVRDAMIYWRHSNGKLYYSFPNYIAGTFTRAGYYALDSLPVDNQGEGVAVESSTTSGQDLDDIQYVVVEDASLYEDGVEYPELGGKFVGVGAYVIGYQGEEPSLVLPLQIEGIPVVSADLSWNEGARRAMTRISSLEFERSDMVGSALVQLNVSGNQLHALDVTPLSSLRLLDCQGNPLDDCSGLVAWAGVEDHKIKGLDSSGDKLEDAAEGDRGAEGANGGGTEEEATAEEQPANPDEAQPSEVPDESSTEPSMGQAGSSDVENDSASADDASADAGVEGPEDGVDSNPGEILEEGDGSGQDCEPSGDEVTLEVQADYTLASNDGDARRLSA